MGESEAENAWLPKHEKRSVSNIEWHVLCVVSRAGALARFNLLKDISMPIDSTHAGNLRADTSAVSALDWIALILMIVGGLNWGLVGAFNFDLVATLFGAGSMLSRAVYVLVGLAAVYGIFFLTRLGSRRI